MLSQGKEISSLDFRGIIGGPLQAVVRAQADAAAVTTNFIQSFAFTKDNPPKLQAVTFDFSQVIGAGLDPSSFANSVTTFAVPLLTLIPIPYIRVDTLTIDLNVNLHSVNSTTMSNDFVFSTSGSGGFAEYSFGVSVTEKNTYQNSTLVDDSYSMHVTVHAVQDQMPGGMAQVLGIFSNIIQSQATVMQTIVAAQAAALNTKAQAQIKAA